MAGLVCNVVVKGEAGLPPDVVHAEAGGVGEVAGSLHWEV